MPGAPRCPMCHAPHHLGNARPGTRLVCESCHEVFEAGMSRGEADASVIPDAEPVELPVATPSRRSGTEAPRTRVAKPVSTEKVDMDRGRETRVLLVLGAGCVLVFFLILGAVGAGTWFVVDRINEQAAQEEAARQEAASQPKSEPLESEPVLPAFKEPVNPYKPGTQTKLRELRSVELPELPAPKKNQWPATTPPYVQVIHSPQHGLLFVRSRESVWVYDLKTNKAIGPQSAKRQFTDMS